jgi:hypothetical protein
VVLTNPRNRFERQLNDTETCKLELRGGSGGKVVGEALHMSFYRVKCPGAFQTMFRSLSPRESKIDSVFG